MDGFGIFFGDENIDTITHYNVPLQYLNPQVKNPLGNVITDSLNWIAITGTFVANGIEKYALLGNFLADNAVTTASIGGPYFPQKWTDVCIDDVSCIELNLPAFAGRDTTFIPGDSLFLGREPDVGIDEACVWYKLPSTTPIDTVAGFWIKPTEPCTYVVRQEICGLVKWDTVRISLDAVGIKRLNALEESLKVYPLPADELLHLSCELLQENEKFILRLLNNLGQMVREEELIFEAGTANITTDDLPPGVYFLQLKGEEGMLNRKIIISR